MDVRGKGSTPKANDHDVVCLLRAAEVSDQSQRRHYGLVVVKEEEVKVRNQLDQR